MESGNLVVLGLGMVDFGIYHFLLLFFVFFFFSYRDCQSFIF